jgi:uncharacterized protein YidB (DUF937 family)
MDTEACETVGDWVDQLSGRDKKMLLSFLNRLAKHKEIGGFVGLLKGLRDQGLDEDLSSWMGQDGSRPLAPEALERALGQDQIASVAEESGLAPPAAARQLARLVPDLVDQLTPDGQWDDSRAAECLSLARTRLVAGTDAVTTSQGNSVGVD